MKTTPSHEEKRAARTARQAHRDHRIEHIYRRILYIIERIIATITLIVLLVALGFELYRMVTVDGYLLNFANTYLHNILTIVVGLEFVRMLIDTTPASILEVLTVAITRYVIINHNNIWNIVGCVACIAGLFAIRRFLISHKELTEEMVENE